MLWAGRVCVAIALSAPSGTLAQPLPETIPLDSWGPAGRVEAVARHGNTLYVGGAFSYVGPGTGPFAAFVVDAPSAVAASGFGGSVDTVAALPAGGWIIGGQIRRGSDTLSIARLDADGRIDTGFFVDVFGSLRSLATDGTRLFIGGTLFTVNGMPRTAVAAVDPVTGTLLPWNVTVANSNGTPEVTRLLVHQGVLYAIGRFTALNGVPRSGFAAIDAATGALLSTVLPELTTVDAIAASGDRLYAAGRLANFQSAGVAISIATGLRLPWAIPDALLPVSGLVASPTRVYVSTFASLRALDPESGATIGPPLIANGSIRAMEIGAGILAVSVNRFVGTTTNEVLTFDAGSGLPRSWSVLTDASVTAIAISSDRVAFGGTFKSAGGVARQNVCAIDLRSGRPTAFAPSVDNTVTALAVVGDVLVVGGRFTEVNGAPQWGVAAVSTATGALIPWRPLRDGWVNALAATADRLFIGGEFRVVSGYSRPYLAGIDLSTGGPTAWLPVPDGAVVGLAVANGALLTAGGFTAVAGGPRGGGAAYSLGSDALLPWDPGANFGVSGVAVAGSTIGLVGPFTTLHGEDRQGFGLVSASGAPLPLALPFSTFSARAIASLGSRFFVGGRFVQSNEWRSVFAYSPQSGLLPWNPPLDDNGGPAEVSLLAGFPDLLVVGGSFTRSDTRRLLNLAVFPLPGAGPPTAVRARVTGTLVTLAWAPPVGTAPSSYIVEAGTSVGASNVGRFAVPSTGAAGGLAPGTYYVRVRAVVAGVEGASSSEVILTIPASPAAPAAPDGLGAVVTGGAVSLAWTAAAGNAESYVIEAGTSPGQSNLGVVDTGVLDTTFVANVPPGTYYVRVRARNSFGTGPASNEAVVVVP